MRKILVVVAGVILLLGVWIGAALTSKNNANSESETTNANAKASSHELNAHYSISTKNNAATEAVCDATGSASSLANKRPAGERMTMAIDDVEVAFRWIPAGSFIMGGTDDKAYYDEQPAHKVIITKGYWLAETPTTQRLWQAVMGANPSRFQGDDLRPVENVSWHDSNEFIDILNSSLRSSSDSAKLGRFRLPTEAEWEYACRAGTTGKYNVSGESLDNLGWYAKNSNKTTHAVGCKRANAWGLYDMHGNVYEWCADWYGDYPNGTVTDPTGPSSGSSRVLRGGSWFFNARDCRSAFRNCSGPAIRYYNCGFRLLLTDEQ